MRTILLILFTVILVNVSQAQWRYYSSIVDSGDSVGTPFSLEPGHILWGVVSPALQSGQDTLQFDVKGQQNNATFRKLKYEGAYYTITLDTLGDAHSLDAKATGGWQVFQPVFEDPFTVKDTFFFQSREMPR